MPCPNHNLDKKCRVVGCERPTLFRGKCPYCKNQKKKSICDFHSPHGSSKREDYIKYKKDFCEKCGISNKYDIQGFPQKKILLTIHHIDENARNNEPSNLMTLCRNCHDKEHNMI